MSAISEAINTISNAVYGEQVRGAIVSALEQCYSDVNSPILQSEGFYTALEEAYAGGILDIQTVTLMSSMTNQNIIYRYDGTEAGKNKGLYFYNGTAWVLIGSEVQEVSLASQMTDTKAIYKYTGTETGMVNGSIYAYNGTEWIPIGSGMLTASLASEMTNTGAIYKYTGTEAGYVSNALYYYQDDSWVLLSLDSIVGDLDNLETKSRSNIVSAINEVHQNNLNDEQKINLLSLLKNAVYSTSDAGERYSQLADGLGFGADYSVNPFVGNSYEDRGVRLNPTTGAEIENTDNTVRYFISSPIETDNLTYNFPWMDVPFTLGVTSVNIHAFTKSSNRHAGIVLGVPSIGEVLQAISCFTKDFYYIVVVQVSANSTVNNTSEIERVLFKNAYPISNERTGYKPITIKGLSKSDSWETAPNGTRYIKIWDSPNMPFTPEHIVKVNEFDLLFTNRRAILIPFYYEAPQSLLNAYVDNPMMIDQVTDSDSNTFTAIRIRSAFFTQVISLLELQGVDSITLNERNI